MAEIRLAKIMADRRLCSRREAEKMIAAGLVRVDGVVVSQQGCKFSEDVAITIERDTSGYADSTATIMIHKPDGYVSNLPEPGQLEARELLTVERMQGALDRRECRAIISQKASLAVAGRLDRASRGLLLMTFNGLVVKYLTALKCHEKEYIVTVEKKIEPSHIQALCDMRDLAGEVIQPMQVKKISHSKLCMVLNEGKNQQIRRACRKAGLNVMDLMRVRVGPLTLGDLKEGCWRVLREDEVKSIVYPEREAGAAMPT